MLGSISSTTTSVLARAVAERGIELGTLEALLLQGGQGGEFADQVARR